jgi:hypothetical protein
MSHFRILTLAAFAGLLSVATVPNLRADEWNKKTILTTTEPIQVPNQVLQPGTYVMKLVDSNSDRHIVQVFDKDEQHLITTVLAIPNYRLKPTGKTAFQFWEVPAGQPRALRAWFYPGDNFGQEFAYPKTMSTQIAAYSKTTVPTTYAESTEELSNARVGTVDESGKSADLDKETYSHEDEAAKTAATPEPAPTPAPQEVAQNEPPREQPATAPSYTETKPAELPRELPHTATDMPLIGLIGLLSLVGFIATLRRVRAH